jgi:hypothetical protein
MFFRLTNSPATFQMIMDTIFREQIAQGTLMVYMDNIAVHTKREPGETEERHLARYQELIKEMLTILRNNDLYLNIDKCQFEKTEADYLGVRVGSKEIQMGRLRLKKLEDGNHHKMQRKSDVS